ncbi:hypothetical protein B0H11DRAFT_1740818 [Mycena galericulata]|nr:hypothetical protein B0H11DRAFT_1740818 [Mycena galericulata]
MKTPVFPVTVPPAGLSTFRSTHYELNSSHDENWSSLTPPHSGGFIFHPLTETFYAVSLYHQLHCLNSLRKNIAKGPQLTLTPGLIAHANHCLDYLREALLCHADTTLEPVQNVYVDEGISEGNHPRGHIDQVAMGWGVDHRCYDWTFVREYLEHNYSKWPKEYQDEI